jgi:hypothetical protein
MKNEKEVTLTNCMEGFQKEEINYTDYEVSFRRWLVSQVDSGNMSLNEVRDRFQVNQTELKRVFKRWQELYSDELHLSLKTMSSKDRADNGELEKRIKELENQLELAQMKNVALNTMIDIAEKDYKLAIRKKSGPKQ